MALDLKYRPLKYADILGQERIVEILKSLIKRGEIPPVFLLTGAWGAGKTTLARVLAQSLLCKSPKDGEACGECRPCQEFLGGHNVNIEERDSASQGSVDDARKIAEDTRLSPIGESKRRVLILDECLSYNTRINLADGTKMAIGKIVSDRINAPVLAYDFLSKTVVQAKIKRWIASPKNGRKVYKFSSIFGGSLRVTGNHNILLQDGSKIQADNLKLGDRLLTLLEFPSILQQKWLVAFLLSPLTSVKVSKKDFMARYVIRFMSSDVEMDAHFKSLFDGWIEKRHVVKEGKAFYVSYQLKPIPCPPAKEEASFGEDPLVGVGKLIGANDVSGIIDIWHRVSRAVLGIDITSQSYLALKLDWEKYAFANYVKSVVDGFKLQMALTDNGVILTSKDPAFGSTFNWKQSVTNVSPAPIFDITSTQIYKIDESSSEEDPHTYFYNLEIEKYHNYFAEDRLVANCHMLSKQAQNSLLKMFEEGTKGMHFILCTTEPDKMLPTIRSRSCELPIRLVDRKLLVSRLKDICEKESFEYDLEGLKLIATSSAGHVRDAIKMLDHMSVFGALTIEKVRAYLKYDINAELLKIFASADSDIAGCLQSLETLLEKESPIALGRRILRLLLGAEKIRLRAGSFDTDVENILAKKLVENWGDSIPAAIDFFVSRGVRQSREEILCDFVLFAQKLMSGNFAPKELVRLASNSGSGSVNAYEVVKKYGKKQIKGSFSADLPVLEKSQPTITTDLSIQEFLTHFGGKIELVDSPTDRGRGSGKL